MSLWDKWGDERGCDEGHWHAHPGGLPRGILEFVGTVQVHCSRVRLLRRELEFHVLTINKKAHTKNVWKLIVCTSYIYIYIYICVCVCVCVCDHFVIDQKREKSKYFKWNRSFQLSVFSQRIIYFVLTYVYASSCCFPQRTYVAQGHMNGEP